MARQEDGKSRSNCCCRSGWFSVSRPHYGLHWALKHSARDRCNDRDANGKSFHQID